MEFSNVADAALSLWDYYYLSAGPSPGEDAVWRRIECATCRIHESLGAAEHAGYTTEERVGSARRVRRAARECSRLIPRLQAAPPWTLVAARAIEERADTLLENLNG